VQHQGTVLQPCSSFVVGHVTAAASQLQDRSPVPDIIRDTNHWCTEGSESNINVQLLGIRQITAF
jgi:hypothetical protein